MKIKLYFDKCNLGRLAVAMIFAAVLFWKIGFSVWALPVFGACYFLFKSLEVELSEKIPWVWTGLMIGASSIFSTRTCGKPIGRCGRAGGVFLFS